VYKKKKHTNKEGGRKIGQRGVEEKKSATPAYTTPKERNVVQWVAGSKKKKDHQRINKELNGKRSVFDTG